MIGTNLQRSNNSGFTLVEVLVAIFIFSVIMMAVGSAFVSALNVQRRAFNVQQVIENGSYVMDVMLKEVRVSKIIPAVPDSCDNSPPYTELTIEHPDFGPITYSLQDGNIYRRNNNANVQLNSNTVAFTNFKFCVSGAVLSDKRQPRVTIFASLKSKKTQQQDTVDIQTTLSPRYLNK